MTYIEAVNNLLRRLRERTVSTVNETTYSSLLGILLNDAKEDVENAYDWSGLRLTLTAVTQPNVFNYELNGSRNRGNIIDVVNEEGDYFLQYRTSHQFNQYFLNQPVPTGNPKYYSFNGVSSDGDTLVDLYPIPDDAYTLYFNMVLRPTELLADADKLLVPSRPVLLLAYAKAIEERGEDGGVASTSAYIAAENALRDAIAFDAAKHPEEMIWHEV